MAENVTNGEFIELNYTGLLEDGAIFDTTVKEEAQKAGLPSEKLGPVIICVGEKQLLPGLDEQIIGKELGKEYNVNLTPEKAFGKRDVKKIKIVPGSTFKEHKVQPQPGLQVNVDGEVGVITRIAGGRVMVNFNHPLAGKDVKYKFTITKKISDKNEQLTSFLNNTLQIPKDKIAIDLKNENKLAEITMPVELPPQFNQALGKKLGELVGLEVTFKVGKHEHGPECKHEN
jgi:FKBP-type peptidyl-prolyl cis-trans isomerase 2